MAWAFGASGSLVSAANTDTTSLQVPFPSGITSGQLLLMALKTTQNSATYSVSNIVNILHHRNLSGSITLFGKIASGSESGNVSVENIGQGDVVIGQIARYTGAPASITGIVHGAADTGGSGTNIPIAALSISAVDTLVVILGGKNADITSVNDEPDFTEIGDGSDGSTAAHMVWNFQIQTTAVNIGSGSWTVVGDVTATRNGMTVSLLPGQAPATTIFPTAGSVTSEGRIPGLLKERTVTPGAGALSMLGLAPFTQGGLLLPGVGLVNFVTDRFPTLLIGSGPISAPDRQLLALTGPPPSLYLERIISPSLADLSGDESAIPPTVLTEWTSQPAVGSAVIQGRAPVLVQTLVEGLQLRPATALVTLNGLNPVVILPVGQTGLTLPLLGGVTMEGRGPLLRLELLVMPEATETTPLVLIGRAPVLRTSVQWRQTPPAPPVAWTDVAPA